jgi:site-specific DNA recombinase
VITLGRLTKLAKNLGELIDRYLGKWSQLRVGDQIDTRTASSALVLNILAPVSHWERGVISEPTKDALAYRKANREQTGGVLYGWQLARDGVHLDANAKGQAIIQAAHELKGPALSLR